MAQADMGATGIVVLEGMIRQQNSPCGDGWAPDPLMGLFTFPGCVEVIEPVAPRAPIARRKRARS
ncbi:MAG: hypothetical protein ACR652_15680 [Methylocystis sp.]|uniref:hypothetical protein n=1 Tax=Methylocystis sp. TaxID=1911079 RepID=UPI003DA4D8CC